MRRVRVRFTVRRMMIVVAIAVLGTWLSITALKVANDREGAALFCVWRSPETGEVSYLTQCNPGTFWPRYLRRLTGRPWPGDYRCSCANEYTPYTMSGKQLVRSFDQIDDSNAFGNRLEAERSRLGSFTKTPSTPTLR